jgi:oligopeptide/dipeptide ABC transporter ATP-binding protein
MDASDLLRIEGLHVDFDTPHGVVRAVDNVDITVRHGEIVAIVGESGSGKSVTSLAVMGLLPPSARITAGRINFETGGSTVNNHPVNLLTLPKSQMATLRGDRLAMIFQEPMTSLNPLHTVGHQIAEVLMIHRRMPRRHSEAKAIELLANVGIPEPGRRASAYPHELSGGMRQRVIIAMALACTPQLLIADEPTTALDVTIQAQIMELFRSLRDMHHQAMLFITHDLGVVAEIANRVYVMYSGQVVESGDVISILKHPRHPYTQGLLASLPRVDRPVLSGGHFFSIPGQPPEPGKFPMGCRFQDRCPRLIPNRCTAKMPPLTAASPSHAVRCLLYEQREGVLE